MEYRPHSRYLPLIVSLSLSHWHRIKHWSHLLVMDYRPFCWHLPLIVSFSLSHWYRSQHWRHIPVMDYRPHSRHLPLMVSLSLSHCHRIQHRGHVWVVEYRPRSRHLPWPFHPWLATFGQQIRRFRAEIRRVLQRWRRRSSARTQIAPQQKKIRWLLSGIWQRQSESHHSLRQVKQCGKRRLPIVYHRSRIFPTAQHLLENHRSNQIEKLFGKLWYVVVVLVVVVVVVIFSLHLNDNLILNFVW